MNDYKEAKIKKIGFYLNHYNFNQRCNKSSKLFKLFLFKHF